MVYISFLFYVIFNLFKMVENISQNLVEEFINDVIIENYEIEF
jgi:hypothetical protein